MENETLTQTQQAYPMSSTTRQFHSQPNRPVVPPRLVRRSSARNQPVDLASQLASHAASQSLKQNNIFQ